MSVINRLNSSDQGFDEQLTQLLAYDEAQDSQIESAVQLCSLNAAVGVWSSQVSVVS